MGVDDEPTDVTDPVVPTSDGVAGDNGESVHVGTMKAAEPDLSEGLPIKPYKGTPLWRRLVAILGLGAFSVLGGIAIALTIAALIATAAIVLQLVIS